MAKDNKNRKKEQAGHNIHVIGNKCYRCGHAWIPRNTNDKPAVCPKCKNAYWDRPKKKRNG